MQLFYALLVGLCALTCAAPRSDRVFVPDAEKQRGAHLFARLDGGDLAELDTFHLEWITLVPWAYQQDWNSSDPRHHRGDSTEILRRDSAWIARIGRLRAAGYRVFVKPHLWITDPSEGSWRAEVFPDDWTVWSTGYRDFILRYARLAAAAGAEQFCVGTELTRVSGERPEFWRSLVAEVRTIYPGKLTYAANWYREFEQITFWETLDYIGVQAYFPLTEREHPDVGELERGWQPHLRALAAVAQQHDRPLLFTELGYKSTPDAAIRPWEWMEHQPTLPDAAPDTQSNCYRAFFTTVWDQPWFAGVHLWQLRGPQRRGDPSDDRNFTPQGKPATAVIARGFAHEPRE